VGNHPLILANILEKPQTFLFTWPEKTLDALEVTHFENAIARRKKGEPVAYIVGKRDFWTLSLFTSPDTLIPRPDTEVLVEQVLNWAVESKREPLAICDLGTGTGAIALALASELLQASVVGVDFQTGAVELATRNAEANGVTNAQFLKSDWFSALTGQSFDVIVSNPPYIEEASPYLYEGDVRFEPKTALTSGVDGLHDIRHIISTSPMFLNKGGLLAFEHGFNQGRAVRDLLLAAGFSSVRTVKDYGENDRVTFGVWL